MTQVRQREEERSGETPVPYRDLREWLQRVEEMGELQRIEGADWNLEIGALTEIVRKELDPAPALLFDQIKDYPAGYRVLVGMVTSLKRLCLTTNLPGDLTELDFVQRWRAKMRAFQPLPPVWVEDGPLLENVATGTDIDLLRFPTPLWHERDGGRYLGTGHITITRGPDEDWVNLGTYRIMLLGRDTLSLYISPGRHGRIQMMKYLEQGQPFQVAISFGHDPLLFLASGFEVPYGMSEYDYAGGIRGVPYEVVRGEVTGLPIPAHAEIAIEGVVNPGETAPEGPFGEWTGYYASARRAEPIIRVQRLMYRHDPIICGAPPSRPPTEATYYKQFIRSAAIWDQLEAAGVPDVRGVWCHPDGATRLITIVAIKQRYPGHARQAGVIAAQCHAAAYIGRYTIVVDDDIDPTNTHDVLWALATRSDPKRSIQVIDRCWSGPLDPIIHPDQKGFNSRAVIDACRPWEWMERFPAVVSTSPELRERVLSKWGAEIFGKGRTAARALERPE